MINIKEKLERKNKVSPYGFTLIEMMVVLVIVAILAALALPQYQKTVERGRATKAISFLIAVHKGEMGILARAGAFVVPTNIGAINTGIEGLENLALPSQFTITGTPAVYTSATNEPQYSIQLTRQGTVNYTLQMDEKGKVTSANKPSYIDLE